MFITKKRHAQIVAEMQAKADRDAKFAAYFNDKLQDDNENLRAELVAFRAEKERRTAPLRAANAARQARAQAKQAD